MDLYNTAILVGIATYISLMLTFLIGMRIIKFSFKKHKYFAITTVSLATIHAIIFIYLNFF